MQSRIVSSDLHPPHSLTLMITNRCNLKCLHCWPESGSSADCSHVDKKKLLAMIRDFRKLGIEKVCLTGGEPLLHPHWFDIVSFCCAEPGIKEVSLQTNGTLLTEAHVRELASLVHHNLTIQVSIEGSQIDTHDKIRGPGAFQSAIHGLTLLAEEGLANQTMVALTETQDNFLEIPALLKQLNSLGISQFTSGTLVYGGRAARTECKCLKPPTPSQYKEILHRFHTDLTFKELYVKMANIAPLEWHLGKSTPVEPGCVFMKNPYIKADGTLHPCVMFQVNKYAAHDIYERPIMETLDTIIPKWAALRQRSRQRAIDLQPCEICPGRLHCNGGCMGRAYAAQGTLMSVEDRCHLRKEVYKYPSPPLNEGGLSSLRGIENFIG